MGTSDIICICNENNDGNLIQCCSCQLWQHSECVGANFLNEDEVIAYKCPSCESHVPSKSLEKMDSAKDLSEIAGEYQITSYNQLKLKFEELTEGYMVSYKKPDSKMKIVDVVERVMAIEKYLDETEVVLTDDRSMKPYADELLMNCDGYSKDPKDIQFVELAHRLFSKLIVHNTDQVKKMRDSIDKLKAEYSTYFFTD
eukprot:NODE_460_length_7198_cov_0.858290.p7 type:complete len:199 gc:universal NODE_460_length_7198_cov_0.858290:1438-842(-)